MRAIMSLEPPAGKGTINLIGLDGYDPDWAAAPAITQLAATNARAARMIFLRFSMKSVLPVWLK
jgi:hypothetical protein